MNLSKECLRAGLASPTACAKALAVAQASQRRSRQDQLNTQASVK